MAFQILFVCPVGDEGNDPAKQPLSTMLSSEVVPVVPRAGDFVTITFGMARVVAEVTRVHHLLVQEENVGIVVKLKSLEV